MRIAIDARELSGQPTGVGRLIGEMLSEWRQMPEARLHEFVLCAPGPLPPAPADGLRVSTLTRAGGGTLWEQLTLPRLVRRAQADVLLSPAYSGPVLSPVPLVVLIHDVSFEAHPEWFSAREGLRRRVLTRAAARRAARVVTISEFSRREIVERLGVPAERIVVSYPGVPRLPPGRTPLVREPLVLFVGSIFNRRHLPALIEGFARVSSTDPSPRLEIVGDNRSYPPLDLDALIARSAAAARVRARSYIDEASLADLYSRASAFAFLSEYEGFGLTPLEALAAGVPIVVLDTPVAREVYGAAAIYVSEADPALVAAALEAALFDHDTRARVLDAAPAVLARYSWRQFASRVLSTIVEAAR